MCQNKKIYTNTITEQYAFVTSLLLNLKQNLVNRTMTTQKALYNYESTAIGRQIQLLDAQMANLQSLMKSIIQVFQVQTHLHAQNVVIQIQPQDSISDPSSISQRGQTIPQFQQGQYEQRYSVKEQEQDGDLYENKVRGPYRSYTIQEKQQVLQLHKNGMNYARISKLLRIPQKNIVRWCKTGVYRKLGAGRKIGDTQMEQNLKKHLYTNYQLGSQILGRQIRERAKKLTKKSGFKSSKGWLKNFINRYKLNSQYVII